MSNGQYKLLKKAAESIQGAKSLLRDQLYGFAISRAYYAMFYSAEAFLLSKDLAFSKHAAVIAAFGQHFTKTGLVPKEFHQYLIQAQKDRLLGDYDIDVEFTEGKALEQIQRAEAFLSLAFEQLGE